MSRVLGLALLALLTACSNLPAHNPQQAWVDLSALAADSLQAVQLDGQPWAAADYFQVTPGSHTLGLSFQFVAADDDSRDPEQQSCDFSLSYENFKAGKNYHLVAGWYPAGAWLRLLDERGEQLAYETCGSFGDY